MDPNATLKELNVLLSEGSNDHDRIEELCEALEEWLKSGGFPPDEGRLCKACLKVVR